MTSPHSSLLRLEKNPRQTEYYTYLNILLQKTTLTFEN